MSKPRLIAFYLPQFYPTKENDERWQPGFTEWTNVGRAKPLFPGHHQPKVPADLGYYDLRVPETREKQVELAKEAGIEGFCYWHYWFAGKRLLDRVFKEVVESGKPDFPFCLCWANHSWLKKVWDPTKPNTMLMEQTYPGEQDYIDHFYAMLPAFKDPRYMKCNGKLIFGLFAALDIPDVEQFKSTWNRLAKENGLEGFWFFGLCYGMENGEKVVERGFDAACVDYMQKQNIIKNPVKDFLWHVVRKFTNFPKYMTYNKYSQDIVRHFTPLEKFIPCIGPNFDHSPRSRNRGVILLGSTPQKWYNLCCAIFNKVKSRHHEENIVVIKSWNEWGEGNYLEPDLQYGKQYIDATRKALDETK